MAYDKRTLKLARVGPWEIKLRHSNKSGYVAFYVVVFELGRVVSLSEGCHQKADAAAIFDSVCRQRNVLLAAQALGVV